VRENAEVAWSRKDFAQAHLTQVDMGYPKKTSIKQILLKLHAYAQEQTLSLEERLELEAIPAVESKRLYPAAASRCNGSATGFQKNVD